jgi:hypothetical protein
MFQLLRLTERKKTDRIVGPNISMMKGLERRARPVTRQLLQTVRHASTTSAPQIKTAAEAASYMMDHFANRVIRRRQFIDSNQLQQLAVMLGRPVLNGHDISRMNVPAGTPIPPAHHLVYFTPMELESQLGADGSDRTFNAPGPFTRRMWAGGHMKFDRSNPLRVGEEAEEHTKLISAVAKTSRSAGEMVLVEVEKKIHGSRGLALVDKRSWVFRPILSSDPQGAIALRRIDGNILAPSSVSDVKNDSSGECCKSFWDRAYMMLTIANSMSKLSLYASYLGLQLVFFDFQL